MSYVQWKVVPSSRQCDGQRAVAECRVGTWHSDGHRLCRPQTSCVDGDGSLEMSKDASSDFKNEPKQKRAISHKNKQIYLKVCQMRDKFHERGSSSRISTSRQQGV